MNDLRKAKHFSTEASDNLQSTVGMLLLPIWQVSEFVPPFQR
jgi:hypothetical protein